MKPRQAAVAQVLFGSLFALVIPLPMGAQSQALSQRVEDFSVNEQDSRAVMEGIGLAYHFPVVVEPEASAPITLQLHGCTVETVFQAICVPRGWSYGWDRRGFLLVRKFVTRLYPVDYLPVAKTASSSSSVNLSESATAAPTLSLGQPASPSSAAQLATAGQQAATGGSSSLSLADQNDSDFWGHLESDLKSMLAEGDRLVVNRFAGLVQLRATARTHACVEAYLERVMQRVGRQARISVKVVEVELNTERRQGIDWSLASASIGRFGGLILTGSAATATSSGLSLPGALSLPADTFTGSISAGGVQAVLSALQEQGTVRVESKPEVAALNNQTAFVQISEDQPFFSRTSTTTISAGAATVAGIQPITNTNYAQSTVSFGNVLEITVQIADDLSTKLSLSPALTELKGTVSSPDGQETAPVTGTKRARTTIALRNHETAVIGGFISETSSADTRKIPLLGDVPLVREAFTSRARARQRTELVFLVTVNAEQSSPGRPVEVEPEEEADGGRVPDAHKAHPIAAFDEGGRSP